MEKIELSDAEIKVIKQQLNGEIEVWHATEEQKKLLMGVIDKADALLEKLDAYDDMTENHEADTILWFWHKYQEQETKEA